MAAASLAQSLFSRPRERRATERGAIGTPWRLLGRSCHPTQLTSQQCTQMPQNGSERPFSPICVHSCVPGRSRDRAGPRVPRHQQPHGSRDARALGPDGPSVSCQVHAPGRPIVSVAISVPVCVWCRRWLESKTHALAGQTPPVLRLKAARYKTGGAVGHTAFERVCCVRRCHARSERYSWTTTTSPISVRS